MAGEYRRDAGMAPAGAPETTQRGRRAAGEGEAGAAASERGGVRRLFSRRHDRAGEHSSLGEQLIAGVPARIMRPRLIFIVTLVAILAFGLLMVYSASAVEALKEYESSTYFLTRQAMFIGVGLVLMVVVSVGVPLDFMRSGAMWIIWGCSLLLLLAVLVVGEEHGGATRWIVIAGQQLQPSEFVKPVVIVTAAKIFHEYYEMEAIDTATFIVMLGACVALPLVLIIAEPDLGSCLIIAGTVFAMCFFAGFSYKVILAVLGVGLAATAIFIVTADYRMARMSSDPWADPYDTGYQAVLAIMAFASGGLFGRGIGNSTMKYNYLPEAHNDYILAIIGEELGFVGMLIFFAVYALMVWSIFKIASQSPTVQGRLIAYGCGVLIMLQFLVNALGILGVTPMTGKTMPFISYGGSSMIAMLGVAGLVMRVSLESNQRTVHDERRSRMAVVGEGGAARAAGGDLWGAEGAPQGGYAVNPSETTAGSVHVRSGRRSGFTVVDGAGASGVASGTGAAGGYGGAARHGGSAPLSGTRRARGTRAEADAGRGAADAWLAGRSAPSGGYDRINLDYDPAERLRTRDAYPGDSGSGYGSRGRGSRGRSRDGR